MATHPETPALPDKPGSLPDLPFWAKADVGFTGPLRLDIESSDGTKVYAAPVPQSTTNWAKYTRAIPRIGRSLALLWCVSSYRKAC
jgi:hypothetical protein